MPSPDTRDEAKPRCLTVLHSSDAKLRGAVVEIGSGLCIGRVSQTGIDLTIDDRLLSRRHATITPLGTSGIYQLVDHDSRNGSFVEGARVQRGHLTEGCVIRLGVTVLELTSERIGALPSDDDLGASRDALIGRSDAFLRAKELLDEAADGTAPAIISGEAGTGKTLAAAYIHRKSGRGGPLQVLSCGGGGPRLTALDLVGGVDPTGIAMKPEDGGLRAAGQGTLLLDEIDLLDEELQKTLLDILHRGSYAPLGGSEERPLQARVIASTGANLDAAVEAGVFMEELYRLLSGDAIELPSLRTRRSDIPLLAQHFLRLEEPGRSFDWSATFLEKLLLYDWPLNVRELRTVMRRLTMLEDDVTTLRSAHLPKEIRRLVHMPTEDQLRASAITVHAVPSRAELERMLARYQGDVQRLAEHYAKDRRHVYRWLSRHDLSASEFRK